MWTPVSQLHTHRYCESFLLSKIPTWGVDTADAPRPKEAEKGRRVTGVI